MQTEGSACRAISSQSGVTRLAYCDSTAGAAAEGTMRFQGAEEAAKDIAELASSAGAITLPADHTFLPAKYALELADGVTEDTVKSATMSFDTASTACKETSEY